MHSAFAWGAEQQTIAVWVSAVPTFFSLIAATLVLTAAAAIWHNPVTRPSLRRQSLQMLLWVQGMSLIYNSTYLAETFITGPTKWCNIVTVITIAASNFIDFVVMLIPLNLQLVLVHRISSEGFVRYYILAPLVAAVITALPGFIKTGWGWDPESHMCWIAITEPRLRIRWLVGAWYAWLLLSMVVATISTAIMLVYLLLQTHRKTPSLTKNVRVNGVNIRRVVWRIILYPLVLIVSNCISAVGNFAIICSRGIESEAIFVLWVISGGLYGLVPGAYALIVLFVDPSFSRALRILCSRSGPFEKSVTLIQIELRTQVISDSVDALGGGEAQQVKSKDPEARDQHKEDNEDYRAAEITPAEHLKSIPSGSSQERREMDDVLHAEIAQL